MNLAMRILKLQNKESHAVDLGLGRRKSTKLTKNMSYDSYVYELKSRMKGQEELAGAVQSFVEPLHGLAVARWA